jgi:hypothetical protein
MTQPSIQPSPAQPQVPQQQTAQALSEAERARAALAGVRVTHQQSAERVGQAVASQLASTRAVARATVVAPQAPRYPPPGSGDGRAIPNGAEPVALLGRQHRLHIGWHSTSLAGVARLVRPTPTTGLLLGTDAAKRPVAVRFFRAEPTRVTLVGGVWAAQLLAMRAIAMGATVVAMTIEPRIWAGFQERAVNPTSRLTVLHGEHMGEAVGTVRQPALVIYDLNTSGPIAPVNVGAWQTHLVVLRRLGAAGVAAVQQCDLLAIQRLEPAEAQAVQGVLRLNDQDAGLLQRLENEMLAVYGSGADPYVWLRQTSLERQVLGPAHR